MFIDKWAIYAICRYEVIRDEVNISYPNPFPFFSVLWLWVRGFRTIKGTWKNGGILSREDSKAEKE